MMTFRPGRCVVIPSPGVQVWTPGVASTSTWWNNNGAISGCVAAYQPKGAASLAASYSNLANPGTNDAAPGVAPTWNATDGWTFNGTTQFLTTGVAPASGWSMIIRFGDATSISTIAALAGVTAATSQRWYIQANRNTTNVGVNYGIGNFQAVSPGLSSGVVAIAGQSGYRNGVLDATVTSGTIPSLAILIGARNTDGSAANFQACKIQALAIYSTTLSAGEVATITTAMQAL